MAASLESSISEQKGVVLRVKRKRTDDAVEALVVSHVIPSKRAHLSSDDTKKQDDVTNEVFRLLGTCNERNDSRSKDLLKNVTKTKNKVHDDLKTNFKGIKEQTKKKQTKREAKRESNSDARFRIISKLRQDGSSDDAKSIENLDTKLQRTVSSDSSTDSADDEVKRLFTVYDLIRDDIDDNKRTRQDKTEDTNTILCNSVKMIREKLAVSEVERPDISDENYVYDYYYATKSNKELGDVLEITCFDDDNEFYLETADREFEEMFEEDDDSNDENNWRNDYPDEGAWSSEEDTKPCRMKMQADFGFSYGMDDDDDDDVKYNKRAFAEDLSSDDDDELNDYGQPYSLSSRKEVYNEELSDDPDLDGL